MAVYNLYSSTQNNQPKPLKDPQFLLLLFLNGLMIFLYKVNIQQASTVILTYYIQSLCVGIFHFFRLLSHRNIPNQPKNTKGALFSSFFFMFHYGGFHLAYAFFLLMLMRKIPGNVDLTWLGVAFISILTAGIPETIRLIKKDKERQSVSGFIFFIPYVRIIPIHLFIMLSFTFFEPTKFLYFLLMKTGADIITYFIFRPSKK